MPNYFYLQHGQQYGPVAGRELQLLARKGQLEPDAEVWLEGTAKRVLAKNVKNLFRNRSKTEPRTAVTQADPKPTECSALASSSPAPPRAKPWYVLMADGQRYGPIAKAQLDQWAAERRLDAECQVWQAGWPEWKSAGDIYPALATPSADVRSVLAAPPSPTPVVIAGDGSVVKATIDASRSVSVAVAGDMVSRKELHSHQTTNVYKESNLRAIGDTIGGRRQAPQTAQQCIEELAREIHSGMGVMPFVVLLFFWPAGLYMILTAGKRKAAKVNGLFARLRGFLSQGENWREEYNRLQAEWVNARRSEKTQMIIGACVVVVPFVALFIFSLISVVSISGNDAKDTITRQEIIRLVEEKRFDAARLKARELSTFEKYEVLEDIETAEQR